MEDYKSNSHKSKEAMVENKTDDRKKIAKVATGTLKKKKKSFLSEDAYNIKSYMVTDVIIPTVKRALSDTLDMILYPGETPGRGRGRTSGSGSSKIYYSGLFKEDRPSSRGTSNRARTNASVYDYGEVLLDDRGTAEDVLCSMDELLDVYGIVSIADMYDLVGVTPNYTDSNYGWDSLRTAAAVRTKGGWTLKLPRAKPIK